MTTPHTSDVRRLPAWQQAICDKNRHPTGAPADFLSDEMRGSVPARFRRVVRRSGERLAVADGDVHFTYAELDKLSNHVAQALLARLGPASEPVAVLFDHEAAGIVAILGVLKANKFYAALDPLHPAATLRAMMEDSGARLIVTDAAHQELAADLGAGAAACLVLESLAPQAPTDDPRLVIAPEAEAFLCYTSGSTGRPKGVLGHHAAILNFARNGVLDDHIGPDDRFALVNRLGFSGSHQPLFGALLTGASLHFFDPKRNSLEALAQWVDREEITAFTGGSAFMQLLGVLRGEGNLPSLRLVTCGAEAMSRTHVELMRRHVHAGCILRHALGMTELKLVASYRLDSATPLPDGLLPIGYPERNLEVFLLDESLHAVADGEVGEIAVRSPFVTHGYWRRPDLMQERFRPARDGAGHIFLTGDLARRLPDGCLIHHGRKDFAVKVRGHRVEPGAVEAALGALGLFTAVAVIARSFGENDTRLIAYLQAHGARPTPAALRARLQERLPEYMVPAYFVYLEHLPRNMNGKVDRSAMPALDSARQVLEAPPVAPRTSLEARIVAIWEEVLGITDIGIEDEFLELGGNSLSVARIKTRVDEQLGASLSSETVFMLRTVKKMAEAVTNEWLAGLAPTEIEGMLLSVSRPGLGFSPGGGVHDAMAVDPSPHRL